MNRTQIEWCQNPDGTPGFTWNPITGCLNGCEYCYARRLANTRLRERYLANQNVATALRTRWGDKITDPFYPRFWPERFKDLSKRKQQLMDGEPKQMGVFVCDMSDLFGIGIPEDWTSQIMEAIWDNDEYDRFYLLTKQPQNLIKWSPFPENCYVGVTATNQKAHNEAVVALSGIEASIKFISHEPLLERISLHDPYSPEDAYNWDIIGSQTKPYNPPRIEWVQEIISASDKAGIPVFLKDNLKPLIAEPGVVEVDEFELRQEMPE